MEIGSCEGPVAGPLISSFARGVRQLANRAELNEKMAILERPILKPIEPQVIQLNRDEDVDGCHFRPGCQRLDPLDDSLYGWL